MKKPKGTPKEKKQARERVAEAKKQLAAAEILCARWSNSPAAQEKLRRARGALVDAELQLKHVGG